MNKFKRIFCFILAALMAVPCFGMTASAAEVTPAEDTNLTYDFEITSDMPDEGYVVMPLGIDVDQTFTMTSTHRGADRSYAGTTLGYAVTITNADGNATDCVVVVELHDYNQPTAIQASAVNADGSLNYFTCPITANRLYYFYYRKVSGTSTTLRVHMRIGPV